MPQSITHCLFFFFFFSLRPSVNEPATNEQHPTSLVKDTPVVDSCKLTHRCRETSFTSLQERWRERREKARPCMERRERERGEKWNVRIIKKRREKNSDPNFYFTLKCSSPRFHSWTVLYRRIRLKFRSVYFWIDDESLESQASLVQQFEIYQDSFYFIFLFFFLFLFSFFLPRDIMDKYRCH